MGELDNEPRIDWKKLILLEPGVGDSEGDIGKDEEEEFYLLVISMRLIICRGLHKH